MKKSLVDFAKAPKREKWHWALKLLMDKGHALGAYDPTVTPAAYEVDGKQLSIQQLYKLAARYPEWNDRLGLGTAAIPRVSAKGNR